MAEEIHYTAPWSNTLRGITAFSLILLLGIPLFGVISGPCNCPFWVSGMIVMPLAILFITVFFLIRGFVLTRDQLVIRRLGWSTKLDLMDLVSVEADPQAMAKSIRTCGNGGLFCFAGRFRNKKLGVYRVFATNPARSVVLKFSNRTVVITPDHPEDFVMRLKELRGI